MISKCKRNLLIILKAFSHRYLIRWVKTWQFSMGCVFKWMVTLNTCIYEYNESLDKTLKLHALNRICIAVNKYT